MRNVNIDPRFIVLQSDWNDGIAVCSLVRSLGGPVPGFKELSRDPENWESNLDLGNEYFTY